jgi:hypothetical protein
MKGRMSKKRIRGTLIRRGGANGRLQHELRQILLHEMEICIIINKSDPYRYSFNPPDYNEKKISG